MSKFGKKLIRERFRSLVFECDGNKCRKCGVNGDIYKLDAHHINDRSIMPGGGYVKENGVSLCETCHIKAEKFHSTGRCNEGWHPNDLYNLISSTYEQAYKLSEKLK